MSYLTGVTSTTLSAVGFTQAGVASPVKINGTSLVSDGKPEVLYIGADYCPFCAGERWPLIIALSKFGNFTGLQYMLSSSTGTDPKSPTFTFFGSAYASNYISFVSVELYTRVHNVLQTPTSAEQALLTEYDTSSTIPFVDFGNQFMSQSQYDPSLLDNMNWTYIGSQLNNPNSNIGAAIDAAANYLISAICHITNEQPSSVCSIENNMYSAVLSLDGQAQSGTNLVVASIPELFKV